VPLTLLNSYLTDFLTSDQKTNFIFLNNSSNILKLLPLPAGGGQRWPNPLSGGVLKSLSLTQLDVPLMLNMFNLV
jgi:hypothetical protein